MSFYNHNQRPFTGHIVKKPRMGPRGPHMGGAGNPHADDGSKRLMSFKDFVLAQRDDIEQEEAMVRYSEYKTEFTRKQIDRFFKDHQEEEWFRNKYRPTELKKIAEAVQQSKAKRKESYEALIEKKLTPEFSLDYVQSEPLSKFLENFSLLLEGATLEDIESGDAAKSYSVSSIFIPSLDPSVDKSMLDEYASTHPGYLRVAVSDAQPDRGFRRRAWITYKQMDHDSLKKLCWDYNAHKFNGQETKAIVNKEMNNRIRCTQPWFCHETCAKSDLKNVARLLTYFEGEESSILDSIKDHLIEETNEQEVALGLVEETEKPFEFTQNPELMKVLDRVILYLRTVHSFDYYASTEYTGEDDMPQKIGIMFARPSLPPTFGDQAAEILQEFIEAHKARIDAFLHKPSLSEVEQKQLGKRNVEEEVENFIYQHTFEKVPGERYVCRLTKKKFTAPEFVRKHIFNRCSEKLDEVRTDVEYINNYIADPRRPM